MKIIKTVPYCQWLNIPKWCEIQTRLCTINIY